jgi:hypothetical protein
MLILGYRLLKEDYRDPYEVESKLGPFSFKLNATSLGIFVMTLSTALALSVLIIEPTFEYKIEPRVKNKTVIKAPPIDNPPNFKKKMKSRKNPQLSALSSKKTMRSKEGQKNDRDKGKENEFC